MKTLFLFIQFCSGGVQTKEPNDNQTVTRARFLTGQINTMATRSRNERISATESNSMTLQSNIMSAEVRKRKNEIAANSVVQPKKVNLQTNSFIY